MTLTIPWPVLHESPLPWSRHVPPAWPPAACHCMRLQPPVSALLQVSFAIFLFLFASAWHCLARPSAPPPSASQPSLPPALASAPIHSTTRSAAVHSCDCFLTPCHGSGLTGDASGS